MDIESEAHVLIVGAYRDNEVDEQHPLMKLVGELEKEGKQISNLSLGPLSTVSVETLISEASNNYSPESKSLAELSHEKTNGNPYFLKEFFKKYL